MKTYRTTGEFIYLLIKGGIAFIVGVAAFIFGILFRAVVEVVKEELNNEK